MKVTERLVIKNFYTIKKFDWKIKDFNVLTGEMGSGKSVCVKLLWFCERILHTLIFYPAITKNDIDIRVFCDRIASEFEETFYTGNFDFAATEINYSYSCNGNSFDLQASWDETDWRLKWSSTYLESHVKKWQDFFGNEKTKGRFDISIIVSNQIFKSISAEFHNSFPIGTMFVPAARACSHYLIET